MKTNEINNFKVTGNIHTLSLDIDKSISQADIQALTAVESAYPINGKQIEGKMRLKINPSKAVPVGAVCGSFEHCIEIIEKILSMLGANVVQINRVDFRMDSTDKSHYRQYEKLYRYMITLLSVDLGLANHYRTMDLLTLEQLSVASKSRRIEVEHYDRSAKSRNYLTINDRACSRFEERSKQLIKRYKQIDWKNQIREVCLDWSEIWKSAIRPENIEKTAELINDNIVNYYFSDHGETLWYKDVDFISWMKPIIYTRSQLVSLVERLEVKHKDSVLNTITRDRPISYINAGTLSEVIRRMNQTRELYFAEKNVEKYTDFSA